MIPVGAAVVRVPPQTVVDELEMVSPVGKVSVKPAPLNATELAEGFAIVKVNELVADGEMAPGLKFAAMEGGPMTETLAVAGTPEPPCVEVTALVVLFWTPAAVPVTFALKEQEEPAGRVAPVRVIAPLPCVAVMVPPPHAPVRAFGLEMTRPAGSVSAKPMPVSAVVAFGFWRLKLREVDPFNGIVGAPNAFAIVGGARMVIEAVPAVPGPLSFEAATTALFFTPAVVPCTFAEIVHDPPPGRVAPNKLIAAAPETAVAAPPHVFVRFAVGATTKPAGRVSVNARPVKVSVVFALVILNVREVVPLSGRVSAPNSLAMVGGFATVKLAIAVFPVPPLVEVTFPVVFVY